jgi:hypothetical protein
MYVARGGSYAFEFNLILNMLVCCITYAKKLIITTILKQNVIMINTIVGMSIQVTFDD